MANKQLRRDLEAKIVAHAWKDPSFRKRLLSDSKDALKELNCSVSENMQINVVEEKENQWILVLPSSPVVASRYSESELENMVGGRLGCGCAKDTQRATQILS